MVYNHAGVKPITGSCKDSGSSHKAGMLVSDQQSTQNDGEEQRKGCYQGYEPQPGGPPPAASSNPEGLGFMHSDKTFDAYVDCRSIQAAAETPTGSLHCRATAQCSHEVRAC